MIIGLSCRCAAAPNLFRQFLFANHVKNYLSVPLFKGKDAREWAEEHNLQDVASYISNHSSYVLIVGWDDETPSDWVDINNANSERQLKGEMILEQFAERL